MNQWPYVIAAYVLTGVGTVVLIVMSIMAMRHAEKKVDDL
jgi:heme exporter protein D